MSDKNGIAQILDKVFDALMKSRNDSNSDDMYILPKPNSQEIGNGIIVWRWHLNDAILVESVLATRNANDIGLEKDQYIVNLKMPESQNFSYTFLDSLTKKIGQALLSAWNWQEIWKIHAGDFLLEILSKEPPEEFTTNEPTEIVEAEPVEEEELLQG